MKGKFMYVLLKTAFCNKLPTTLVLATSQSIESLYLEMLTEAESYYEEYEVKESNHEHKMIFKTDLEDPVVILEIQESIVIDW